MPRRRQIGLSLIAAAISASLSKDARGRQGDPPEDPLISEVERLYLEAQERYGAGEFALAADLYHECLENLPEAEEYREIRGFIVTNELQSRLQAFNRIRSIDGQYQFEFLDRADEVLAKYRADFAAAYGDTASVSAGVEEIATELRDARDAAMRTPTSFCLQPCLDPCLQPCLQPCLSPPPPPRGCHGGSDNSIAMLGLLALPRIARRRKDVLASLKDRLPKDVVAKLEDRSDESD